MNDTVSPAASPYGSTTSKWDGWRRWTLPKREYGRHFRSSRESPRSSPASRRSPSSPANRGAYLLAHVFDPEAEKLEEGGTLEGADSAIELGLRQASAEASRILSRIGSSEWSQDAKSVLSEIERAIDAVDWEEKEQAVRDQLDSARKGIEENADYQVLRQQMDKLVEALRTLGRSEEAQKLQKRIEELFGTKPGED